MGFGKQAVRTDWFSVGALLAVALGIAARLAIGDRPIDYDSANYAYVTSRMVKSGVTPLDFFNNKPPGIYYWYRLFFWLFGDGPLACHLTSVIPDLFIVLTIAAIGRMAVSARVGNLAAAIYATLQPAVRLAGYGYTELPMTACLMATVAILTRSVGSPSPKTWSVVLAGLLVGLATLFKQPAYVLGLALATWGGSRCPPRERAAWIVAFGVGFLGVQLALVSWLIRHDFLVEYVDRVFGQGARHGYADGFSVFGRLRDWAAVCLAPMPALTVMGLVALFSKRNLASRGWASALIVPTITMGCLSYEFYDHYLSPALPALSIVVAEWLCGLEPGWLRRLNLCGIAAIHGLALVVFTGTGPGPAPSRCAMLDAWRPRPLTLAYQQRVAAYVAASTDSHEAILSTGSDIPYLSGRRNAYRFLGIAPYLKRLDTTGFDDFPTAARQVRILVLERWRMSLLPQGWVSSLEDPNGGWKRVVELDHPEFVVYRRIVSAPTIGNP